MTQLQVVPEVRMSGRKERKHRLSHETYHVIKELVMSAIFTVTAS